MAILTFSPPHGYPRLTQKTILELKELLDSVGQSAAFAAIVLAANDDSFATGADLAEVSALDGVSAPGFALMGQDLCRKVNEFRVPVVAAIRGYCFGGGLDLALACQARVASYDASFAHPGPSDGLMTGWSGTQRLARQIGKAAALEILLTAERIPATQALTLGLINELVSSKDLLETAVRRAARIQTLDWPR
ncbi:MAG: enoyl-CoA hydratase/isomerase family protein [Terriglobia bacterium]